MKCPNCGKNIPEGHMYCDDCGTEINIVPDFEPEVENEINISLSGLADELNKDARKKLLRKEKIHNFFSIIKAHWRAAAIGVVAVIGLVLFVVFLASYNDRSSNYYMGLAESAKSSGNMEQAIGYLKRGMTENPGNSEIIFRLSDYYMEAEMHDEAVETLKTITSSDRFADDIVITAYEGIISIYKQTGEFDKITEVLSDTDNKIVAGLRAKYVPSSPIMLPESGTYEGIVQIKIITNDNQNNPIYYTVNGDVPTTESILYEGEIAIETDGEYNIKAACVNDYGIFSTVTECNYVLEKGAPVAPEIMEPSGDYNQNTMIVAVAEQGYTIFYTTDGSDPTMESKQYISPITMPVGTSHFKFATFDQDGNSSEIVERDYHLVFTRLVSTEQAVNSLVSTLVRLDILLDASGKVRGVEGHNEYIYNSEIEIQGAGEYYVIIENHVSNDGKSAPTGLMYAVNTHDGTVNRLGYDSSGKYTLITISNR